MKLIGLDIGGSHIGVAEFEGSRLRGFRRRKLPRNLAGFREILRRAAAGADGIGVSVAGIVAGTKIIRSPNISYLRNFDFRTVAGGRPLAVENDARAFARAELRARPGVRNMFAVTLGTGVGRAYAARGRVLKIKALEYPERWEKEYQRGLPPAKLAGKLYPLIREYESPLLVFGGGAVERGSFFRILKAELRRLGVRSKMEKHALPDYAAARGACLLLLQKRRK